MPALAYLSFFFSHQCRLRHSLALLLIKEISQKISKALAEAGIDSRTTSVKVVTTSDHSVYLTGLISDKDKIKLAGDVAAKTAPTFRIFNQIHSSFFDDPNHVTGDKTK